MEYNSEFKKKKWQDMKAAVAHSINSIDDVLLNVNNVTFDSLVCQTAIQTEEDKQKHIDQGYYEAMTEAEFTELFPSIDPSCIVYSTSVAGGTMYFNPKTLAACPLHIGLYTGSGSFSKDTLYEAIKKREGEAKGKHFFGSLLTLPDAMRLEYFERLLATYHDIPDLYHLFFSSYKNSDYGFTNVNPDVLGKVLASKTEKERKETADQLAPLPDTLKIYRGGSWDVSTPPEQAYSWSLDINTANFFATRRGVDPAYIAYAEVAKEKVIEVSFDISEQEIIVDPKNVHIIKVEELKSIQDCREILGSVAPIYHKYLDEMDTLTFARNSFLHGKLHEARVLLHCLTIAHLLGLPNSDVKVLATAAIYHDTQRRHDFEDPAHGADSAVYYRKNIKNPNPVVAFLIEYHCLPDEEAYARIKETRALSKNRSKTTQLFNIFKDADALDRIRLPGGIRELDVDQLREPISKSLTLLARLYLDSIKL